MQKTAHLWATNLNANKSEPCNLADTLQRDRYGFNLWFAALLMNGHKEHRNIFITWLLRCQKQIDSKPSGQETSSAMIIRVYFKLFGT